VGLCNIRATRSEEQSPREAGWGEEGAPLLSGPGAWRRWRV
jgi:hypothetical protein